jgi:hypothetical protein
MGLRLECYSNDRIAAIRSFNARIANAVPYALGTGSVSPERTERAPVWLETLLAVDGEDVRGGVMLQHQRFRVGNDDRDVVNIQLPLSEGVVDRKYAHVGMWIVKSVLARHPFAFAVGMGGLNQPLPRLLKALGWDVRLVPFAFYVHRPHRFLRGMPPLRRTALARVATSAAAFSGVGPAVIALKQAWRGRGSIRRSSIHFERVDRWDVWADGTWDVARAECSVIGSRTSAELQALYPTTDDRYLCYRVRDGSLDVGWATLIATRMQHSDKFGDLHVGTLLDSLARPGYERAIARGVRDVFRDLGVDLSLANHSHAAWIEALAATGYWSGPSNYVLATSPTLSAAARHAMSDGENRIHITRGDGDGRIHL